MSGADSGVRSALSWLDAVAHGEALTESSGFGAIELGLVTALDWMEFRDAYPITRHARIVCLRDAHRARPSLSSTRLDQAPA